MILDGPRGLQVSARRKLKEDRSGCCLRFGAVTALVGRYHDETAEGGRCHRVIVAVHPAVQNDNASTVQEDC